MIWIKFHENDYQRPLPYQYLKYFLYLKNIKKIINN